MGQLGHGEEEDERAPRLVETLAGNKVIGAVAGTGHTAVWTEAGELENEPGPFGKKVPRVQVKN